MYSFNNPQYLRFGMWVWFDNQNKKDPKKKPNISKICNNKKLHSSDLYLIAMLILITRLQLSKNPILKDVVNIMPNVKKIYF